MTPETCPRCGAPRTEATPFCTNCGNPWPAAGGPGSTPPPVGGPGAGGPHRGKLALIIGAVLVLLIGGAIAAAVVLGGDDEDGDSEGAVGSGDKATFCEIWDDFDQADAGGPASLAEMRDIADRMRAAGTPDDITDEAQQGIDVLLRTVDDADSDEEMGENVASWTTEEQHHVQAAVAYAEETCHEAGSDGGTDTNTPGTPGTSPDGQSPGPSTGSSTPDGSGSSTDGGEGPDTSTTGVVTEAEFCAGMRELDGYDQESNFDEGKALIEAMGERGAPAEFPADVQEGFALYVQWVSSADSPEEFGNFVEQVPRDEQRKIKAFIDHMESTCLRSTGASPDATS